MRIEPVRTISSDSAVRVIEGIGIPFGGPFRGSDSYGTRATAKSNLHLDLYPDGGPLLYHHGLDPDIGFSRIGTWKPTRTDPAMGVWVQAQLDRAHAWSAAIESLLDEKALGFSAGTRSENMTYARGGDWLDWPVLELSLEPVRSNPWAVITSVRSADTADLLRIVADANPPAAPADAAATLTTRAAAMRYSTAADDASCGAGALGSLLYLISEEAGEDDQVAMLQRAADALTEWITAERAEVGEPGDNPFEEQSPVVSAIQTASIRAGRRNSAADQDRLDQIGQHASAIGDHVAALSNDTSSTSSEGSEPASRTAEAQPAGLLIVSGPVRVDADPLRTLAESAAAATVDAYLASRR